MTRKWLPTAGILAASVLGTGVFAVILAQGESAKYAGTPKCRKCHLSQAKSWEKMSHSRAFADLKPADLARSDDLTGKPCVACHTTGHGRDGGFVSAEATPDLTQVGCESCHGPGSAHASQARADLQKTKEAKGDMKILRIDRASCTSCHNPHVSYKEKYGSAK